MNTLINQLIEYCKSKYSRDSGKCCGCERECIKCELCLSDIHSIDGSDRHYECLNATYCYVCRHIHRYSSEIEHLLNKYIPVFRKAKELEVWSIGCGPSSELFSLLQFNSKNNLKRKFHYKGFELNNKWKDIHDYILSNTKGLVSYEYCNVFDYYANTDKHPNVIILNYVISDIIKFQGENAADEFVENICDIFLGLQKGCLIINDINLGRNKQEARYYFDIIADKLYQCKFTCRFHFANTQRDYFQYGYMHDNNNITSNIPEGIDNFNPWTECRSAQLIVFRSN